MDSTDWILWAAGTLACNICPPAGRQRTAGALQPTWECRLSRLRAAAFHCFSRENTTVVFRSLRDQSTGLLAGCCLTSSAAPTDSVGREVTLHTGTVHRGREQGAGTCGHAEEAEHGRQVLGKSGMPKE